MKRFWYGFWWRIGRWIGYRLPDTEFRIGWFFLIASWYVCSISWKQDRVNETEEYGKDK